jgi:hypothetical protein
MELVVRAWDLRPRRVSQRLAKAPAAVLPSAREKSVGTLNSLVCRGSISPPARPLSTLRCALTGRKRMTRGHRDRLDLRCRAFSSPNLLLHAGLSRRFLSPTNAQRTDRVREVSHPGRCDRPRWCLFGDVTDSHYRRGANVAAAQRHAVGPAKCPAPVACSDEFE